MSDNKETNVGEPLGVDPDDLMIAYMSGLHDGKKLVDRGHKPCQTCEALARTVMLDQSSHDITPQPAERKRTWVGLTDEDVIEIIGTGDTMGHFIRSAEAKLKEKNNGS